MPVAEREYMGAPSPRRASAWPKPPLRPQSRYLKPSFAAAAAALVTAGAFLAADGRIAVPERLRLPEVGSRDAEKPKAVARERWTSADVDRLHEARAGALDARASLETEVRRAAARGVPLRVIEGSTGLSRRQIFRIMRAAAAP